MKKENIYINKADQEEFISKKYMRTQLYENLIMQFEIIFYHQAENICTKDSTKYHLDAVKRRLKKIVHFSEIAETFGIITCDEERWICECLGPIEDAFRKPGCLVLVPNLKFLIGKNPEKQESPVTWDELLGFLITRNATSDMTFESISKLMRACNSHDFWDEEIPFTSSEAGDYSPGNPWDAPGMSIRDFL